MISKLELSSFIKKYYLDTNESVKWQSIGGNLVVNFQTPTKEVIGKVVGKGFPTFEQTDICIFDTKKLQSLISICSGDIILDITKNHKIATSLNIKDASYNVSYALADPLLIPKIGNVNEPQWDAQVELSEEDVSNLYKAKSALSEANNLTILTSDNMGIPVFIFSFGDEKGHNNKVTYQVNAYQDSLNNIKIPFNANIFKSILGANKDMESAQMYLNQQGLMKIVFSSDTIESEYFMIRKAEEAF